MLKLIIMSVICALMSGLAIVGISAMTIVPSPTSETHRNQMILAAVIALVAWSLIVVWLGLRRHSSPKASLRPWLKNSLMFASVIYVFAVLAFALG